MNVAFVPIVIWNIFKSEKDLRMLYMVIIISATIMSFYGLYCFVTSSNPYITFLDTYFGRMDFVSVYLTLSRSGFQGKVQINDTSSYGMGGSIIYVYLFHKAYLYETKKISLSIFSPIVIHNQFTPMRHEIGIICVYFRNSISILFLIKEKN